jgi:hypothetical protein
MRPGVVIKGRDRKPGGRDWERRGQRRERRTKGQGGPTLLMSSSLPLHLTLSVIQDEVWLRIRAGAVGLYPCSAKPRSASHRHGWGRLV